MDAPCYDTSFPWNSHGFQPIQLPLRSRIHMWTDKEPPLDPWNELPRTFWAALWHPGPWEYQVPTIYVCVRGGGNKNLPPSRISHTQTRRVIPPGDVRGFKEGLWCHLQIDPTIYHSIWLICSCCRNCSTTHGRRRQSKVSWMTLGRDATDFLIKRKGETTLE